MRALSRIALLSSGMGLTLALAAGPAAAGTIYAHSYSVPNNINVHSTYLPGISNEYSGAGQIVLQIGAASSGPFHAVAEWCTDLFHTLYTPATYQTGALTGNGGGGPISAAQVGQIGALMSHGNYMLASGHYTPGFTANEVSSAIQIAIWSVEYGAAYHFTSDDAKLNGPSGLVASYVAEVAGAHPDWGPNPSVVTISTPGGQGLSSNQNLSSIPEPLSIGLFATGLLGVGMVRLRAATRAYFANT